jgi:hypothetical protein
VLFSRTPPRVAPLGGDFFIRARYETMRAYRLYPMSRDGHIAGDLNPSFIRR